MWHPKRPMKIAKRTTKDLPKMASSQWPQQAIKRYAIYAALFTTMWDHHTSTYIHIYIYLLCFAKDKQLPIILPSLRRQQWWGYTMLATNDKRAELTRPIRRFVNSPWLRNVCIPIHTHTHTLTHLWSFCHPFAELLLHATSSCCCCPIFISGINLPSDFAVLCAGIKIPSHFWRPYAHTRMWRQS